MSRAAMQMALEALVLWEDEAPHAWSQADEDAVAALRAALAEPQTTHWGGCEAVHPECRKPEQEPDGISWLKRDSGYFTAPTPRKPLTDETLWEMWVESPSDVLRFARAIERKHGIGEQT